MLEQKQLDSKKLIGKKEFAIFETSSTSACSTGTLCLGGKKPTIFHMHTADLLSEGQRSNFIQVRYKNFGYFSQFCGPIITFKTGLNIS